MWVSTPLQWTRTDVDQRTQAWLVVRATWALTDGVGAESALALAWTLYFTLLTTDPRGSPSPLFL